MSKPQYAILRFAKYKGPEIGNIEAHNERTKEKYASNPDVDISRSKYNFHLIEPERKYRAEAERQIKEAGCRTRSDSVRVVEALVTATPEFFQGKKKSEIRAYFQEALLFLQQNQDPKTIISAVVHMDEKTPHIADLHLGHKNVLRFDNRPFSTIEENDEYMYVCRVNGTQPYHLRKVRTQNEFGKFYDGVRHSVPGLLFACRRFCQSCFGTNWLYCLRIFCWNYVARLYQYCIK